MPNTRTTGEGTEVREFVPQERQFQSRLPLPLLREPSSENSTSFKISCGGRAGNG